MNRILVIISVLLFTVRLSAQFTQTVRGAVTDQASKAPVSFATVSLKGASFSTGGYTDSLGGFLLPQVPLGRYDVQVTCLGYEPAVVREVVVVSGKQTFLPVQLKESTTALQEVLIRPHVNKGQPLNAMATVSARMLSVEEAGRYAGGFDDPARLASAFAGVAGNTSANGIIVRGNAPRYLQWKMEGVEIPTPNHFGDLRSFGGGTLTGLSSQMLANSDFFTGAFPAEYSNALSGVFDMGLRTGNNEKREHTFQAGLVGIDAASEGPFRKEGTASYLFNYRYSTLALLTPLLPDNAGSIKYQDLSFKFNFPTRTKGVFAVWGLGLADRAGAKAKTDSTQWVYADNKEENDIRQLTSVLGLSHKYFFKKNTLLKTTLAWTNNGTTWQTEALNRNLLLQPKSKIAIQNSNLIVSSYLNKKYNARHTSRTGISLNAMWYNLLLNKALTTEAPPQEIVNSAGVSALVSGFTNSSIQLNNLLLLNVGLNAQWFTLNNHYTVEPRLGLQYRIGAKQTLGVAYGLHSRLERLNYYFNNSLSAGEKAVNKNLDFTKAHHFVFSYDYQLNDRMHLKVEPYYQRLFAVPVVAGTSFSFVNLQNEWFFAEKLENTGAAANYGLDLTWEKYLSKGYYYMLTASVFSARYRGGDGIWRNSRFNRNYVVNVLAGKEWAMGRNRQNVLSINARITYQGGDRFSPINTPASVSAGEVVFDETQAFSQQAAPMLNVHWTASYRINKRKSTREIALKILNVTRQPDFFGFKYNLAQHTVDKDLSAVLIPNLSYKIEF